MQLESMIKSLEAVQEECNRISQKNIADYDVYLLAKSVGEIAYILRRFILHKGDE